MDPTESPTPNKTFLESAYVKNHGLVPNTLYHVPGRGDFYTNDTATVTYVEATYGGERLNQDLQRPLPETTYVVHPNVRNREPGGPSYAHVFVTDSESRTILAHTDRLSRGDAIRSTHTQTTTGAEGGTGYDGGHSFGTSFGGGGERVNITAQKAEINRELNLLFNDAGEARGAFWTIEKSWRELLAKNPDTVISVDLKKIYAGSNVRPEHYKLSYSIDGVESEGEEFDNV